MNDLTQNPKDTYIKQCAEAMRMRYGGPVKIRITKKGNPGLYPKGTWFDGLVGQILEPSGVDFVSVPWRFVMANGDVVPFSCAEVAEKGVFKIGEYYLQFVWEKPYYVEPEAGENMRQLSLGFLRITRMR
jgi:hypothetical protein